MGTNTNELELTERLKLIESMIAEGRRSTDEVGLDVCAVGRGVLRGDGVGDVGQERVGVAGDDGRRGSGVDRWSRSRMYARAAGDDAGPGDWRGVDRDGEFADDGAAVRWPGAADYDAHVFVAIVGAMLATAHATSAAILKWKAQFWCAVVWIAAAVTACFGSDAVVGIAFLSATFLGQIVFGIYAMVLESRQHRARGGVPCLSCRS